MVKIKRQEISIKMSLAVKLLHVLMFAALITPLLLSSKFFFPFISSKTFFFRLIIEFTFGLYLWIAFRDASYRPRWSWVERSIIAYVVVVFVTSLIGINFYRSFWGNVERGEGILTLLHVVAYFFVLANVLRSETLWRRFFLTSVIVSLLVGFYALLQRAGTENFLFFKIFPGDVSRISGTIGNAAFFGGYMLLHVFLSAWLFIRSRFTWQKFLYGALIAIQIYFVNASQTRGALLGLVIASMILLLGLGFHSQKRSFRFGAFGLLSVLILSGIFLWFARDSVFVEKFGGISRLANISRNAVTAESRLLTWQASWDGWKDRFFQGYGYENFNIAFNKYFPPQIFRDSGSQIWFDRAHNAFFDAAVSAGIFGFLAYLGILFFAARALLRYARANPEDRVTALLFGSLLVAYAIQNFFVFDTLTTYMTVFAVLAFTVFLNRTETSTEHQSITSRQPMWLSGAIAAGVLIVAWFAVLKPARATAHATDALYAQARRDVSQTVSIFQEVISSNTYITEEARQKLGEAMLTMRDLPSVSIEARQRGFAVAIDEMRKAVAAAPQDARNYIFLMALYNNQPQAELGSREEVLRLGKKALELSPTRAQTYFEMGQAAHLLGRFDEGIGYFRKAVELNPETPESNFNLALALVIADRRQEADDVLSGMYKSEKIKIVAESSITNLLQILVQKNWLSETIPLYEELLRRNPKNESLQKELNEVKHRLAE